MDITKAEKETLVAAYDIVKKVAEAQYDTCCRFTNAGLETPKTAAKAEKELFDALRTLRGILNNKY